RKIEQMKSIPNGTTKPTRSAVSSESPRALIALAACIGLCDDDPTTAPELLLLDEIAGLAAAIEELADNSCELLANMLRKKADAARAIIAKREGENGRPS